MNRNCIFIDAEELWIEFISVPDKGMEENLLIIMTSIKNLQLTLWLMVKDKDFLLRSKRSKGMPATTTCNCCSTN